MFVAMWWCILICVVIVHFYLFFFFKQKTAYEMRISDWSSDVCSSDLQQESIIAMQQRLLHDCTDWQECLALSTLNRGDERATLQIGRASCRERVCQYV